jgi:drug/metabolite transporter (DMT)-like permease
MLVEFDAMTRRQAFALLHAAVLLFGFAGLFGKWLDLPALTIVLGRAMVAAAALALFLAMQGRSRGRFEWRLGASGALLALHWLAFFQAIRTSTVAIGLLGFASFPLFVLLLESGFAQRRPRSGDWFRAALIAAGLGLLVPEFVLANRVVQGLLWGILAGFSFALLAVCNRQWAARRAPEQMAFWQNACAAVVLLPALALHPAVPGLKDLALLFALGIFCTALAHTVFIASLRVVSAHTASVVAALEPVYGMAMAALLLGEWPDTRTLVGAALIVGASVTVGMRANQQWQPPPA